MPVREKAREQLNIIIITYTFKMRWAKLSVELQDNAVRYHRTYISTTRLDRKLNKTLFIIVYLVHFLI